MVRFFFDLSIDGVLSADDSGVQLSSDEQAELEAVKALTEMATTFAGSAAAAQNMAIAVRDDSGARLCTVALAFTKIY